MDPVLVGSAAAVLAAVVAGLGVRRRARKMEKPLHPGDRAIVHTVYALGHDPTKVLFQLVQGKKAGIRVLTRDGRPLRFYRAAEIKRKQRDPEFRARFMEARRG